MSWAYPDNESMESMARESRAELRAYRAEISKPLHIVAKRIRAEAMTPDDAARFVAAFATVIEMDTPALVAWAEKWKVKP